MLPYSNDGNSVELLTLGNMAKFTLASNAVRDAKLLAMLDQIGPTPAEAGRGSAQRGDPLPLSRSKQSRLRKEAMASIEELRRKGPASRRETSRWGRIIIGALALGCIGAAAVGQVVLGPALRGRRRAGIRRAQILQVAVAVAAATNHPAQQRALLHIGGVGIEAKDPRGDGVHAAIPYMSPTPSPTETPRSRR